MAGLIYGLLGRKLGHSYSVPIHRALGNAAYRLIELEPHELGAFVRRPDIGGLNVTIPYKRDVMAFCDEITPEARAIGSVNTLVRTREGRLLGANTDFYGLSYMAARAGITLSGKKVVIFGSGGSSHTAQAVARAQGACEVVVVSRSGENNYQNLSRHAGAQVLVNTTPVGMYPDVGNMAADPADFPACEGVLDLIYNPLRTALLLRARQLRLRCSDGLPMLVAQARAAAEIFFSKPIAETENERILRLLRQEKQNIVLIGMPGCGKTTVGQALQALTGRALIDVDARIEETAGMSIEEIFRLEGEAGFRRREREQTALAGKESGRIITTGGGVVKDARNYPALCQNGRIYELTRPLALLAREGRPLSVGADLAAMEAERAPLYRQFRDAAVANQTAPEDAAMQIWRDFCEHCGD